MLVSNSKLDSDHLEDGRECADSGDLDETDEGDEAAEDGPKAVRRRLSEFLGFNGWNFGMVKDILLFMSVMWKSALVLNLNILLRDYVQVECNERLQISARCNMRRSVRCAMAW